MSDEMSEERAAQIQEEFNELGRKMYNDLSPEGRIDFQRLLFSFSRINGRNQTPPEVLGVDEQALFSFLHYSEAALDAVADAGASVQLGFVTGMILGFQMGRESAG